MLRGEVWWAVVHLTSVKRAGGPFDWEVPVPRGTAGLDRPSVVKCSEIYTLWKAELRDALGMFPDGLMRQVDRALALALSLPFPDSEA